MTCERISDGEGDAVVDEDVRLTGTHRGDVTVLTGGRLVLAGTVCGDVIADGGDVELYGRVDGRVVYAAGTLYVGSDATVEEGVIDPDASDSPARSE